MRYDTKCYGFFGIGKDLRDFVHFVQWCECMFSRVVAVVVWYCRMCVLSPMLLVKCLVYRNYNRLDKSLPIFNRNGIGYTACILYVCMMVYKQIKLLFHKNLFCRRRRRCLVPFFRNWLLSIQSIMLFSYENWNVCVCIVVKFTKISTKILHIHKKRCDSMDRTEIAMANLKTVQINPKQTNAFTLYQFRIWCWLQLDHITHIEVDGILQV